MIEWFMAGGPTMWPELAAALVALALAVDAGRKLYGATPGGPPTRRLRGRIDGVLFWGGFAALLGPLGTLVGIGQMAGFLETGAEAPAHVVWQGIGVALIPTVFGLMVLTVALLLWYGLRTAYGRKLEA